MKNNHYIINQQKSSADILFHGIISQWDEIQSKTFISNFEKLASINETVNIRINSCGGSVFDGLSIFSAIKNSKVKYPYCTVNTYVEGLAASMASVIALAGDNVYMSRFAQLMIHRVKGVAYGDADKLREEAFVMDELESSLLQIYSERSGKPIQEIQNEWMQSGKDCWFNAKQALSQNLIDAIYDNPVNKPAPQNKNEKQLYNFYNLFIEKTNKMNIPQSITSFFNLNESASEQEILAAMQNQSNQNKSLVSEVAALKSEIDKFQSVIDKENKIKREELIATAIKTGKITETQRTIYAKLAEADYESTKCALDSIQAYKSIASQIQNSNASHEVEMDWMSYQKKNPKALIDLKNNQPEKYAELYEAYYGVKPKLT